MMTHWKTQYEAQNFASASSVYSPGSSLIVGGTTYSNYAEIMQFFTSLYTASQTVTFTITTENAPNENNQVQISYKILLFCI